MEIIVPTSGIDTDGDTVDDSIDNCIYTPNLDQTDTYPPVSLYLRESDYLSLCR